MVVSGPSGVGKGTVIARMLARLPDVSRSVSCTTRPPRPGEVAGRDYHFVSTDEFRRMREAGELLEWAVVHQDLLYGTPRRPVEEALATGQDIILEIDYQGARSVRQILGERAVLVFIAPPSWGALVERLQGRSTEDAEATSKRLASAIHELAHVEAFEYLIINDDLDAAVDNLQGVLLAERQRLTRLQWRPFVEDLLREAGQ
ncbi:MAG: guanylate kinase [Armatimonadetes bacterium]|nr:guanylate kinase [Armatimonadota bacterium]